LLMLKTNLNRAQKRTFDGMACVVFVNLSPVNLSDGVVTYL
jgi:hypothetical protein